MLVVGGDTLAPGEVDVDALLRNNHIHSAAQAFVRSPLHVVKGDTKAVCVLQSEAATVPWTDEVCLGSQNATTCVIAIVMCQVGATVLHIDEGTVEEEDYLQRALRHTEEGAELFLVGGYDDERGTSREIVESLLSWFHRQDTGFTLALACLLEHNTRVEERAGHQARVPRVSGVCVTPSERALRPAAFEQGGPLLLERNCRCMSGSSAVTDVYDAATRQFTVAPWPFKLERRSQALFRALSCLPDEELLEQCSTSPLAEHPAFADEMRRTLRLLCERPSASELFPGAAAGSALRFAWDGAGWRPAA